MRSGAAAIALLSIMAAACTTVGPSGAREHWRVVAQPRGVVATSFGASCRTPCNVRIPDEPFDIEVASDGYTTWRAHYDPARPNELADLAPRPNQAADAAGGAALAGGGMIAAGGGLASATLIGGAAILGAAPALFMPPVRRLEVTLAPARAP
jgi:hypothetical protein